MENKRWVPWTPEEIKLLKKQYPKVPTYELVEVFEDRHSIPAIVTKASRLGLKKTKRCLSAIMTANIRQRWGAV